MSSNQKKIRDIERQMKKFGPDNAELKKRLDDLKAVKEGVQVQEKLRKNSVKYHMVKFIERKKVTRAIRSLDAKIEKNDPDSENLKAKKVQLEEDLAYIMYYPMEQKYVALFPGSEKAAGDEKNNKQFNSKSYNEQAAQLLEKSIQLGKTARVLALQAWKLDVTEGRVDKVAHAMEVEYNGGNGKKKPKDNEEDREYHKYTNNMQPSSALSQFQARNPDVVIRDTTIGGSKNDGTHGLDRPEKKAKKEKRKRADSDEEQEVETDTNSYYVDRSAVSEDVVVKKDKKSKHSTNDDIEAEPAPAAEKKDKKSKKAVVEKEVETKVVEDTGDSFFLEEVDPETEAAEEIIAGKIQKNLSELSDIRKVVNKNKYDQHKRLYGQKTHNNQYSQNKNHKKF